MTHGKELRFRTAMALFAVGEAIADAGEWLHGHGLVRWSFADRCFGLCLWMMRLGERLMKPKR